MSTSVNIDRAELKLKAIAEVLKRPLRDVLESSARVVATQMARTAQPFGTGANALQLGRAAVARDIYKVYKTPSAAYKDIAQSSSRDARGARMEAVFWRAYKDGNLTEAQTILDRFGSNLRGVAITKMDSGAAHRAARDPRSGRVRLDRPVLIVSNPQALERYVKKVQENVGFGKGGFADIARALGKSPRGLREDGDITANWITRHTGFGKFHAVGTADNPSIFIQNTVPYADHILAGGAKSEALRIGRERMIENLLIAVKHEAKQLRAAA